MPLGRGPGLTRNVRRLRLGLAFLAAAGGSLALWAAWLEPASLRIRTERPPVPWPAALPLRIAILSDLHVGSPFNGLAKLRTIVARTNETGPDLVVLLGDYVIQGVLGGTFVAPELVAHELGSLRAPAGVYAVLGNHDGWFGAPRVKAALQRAGIHVVEDTAWRVATPHGAVWLAGISDLWTGRHDLTAALAAVGDSTTPVLLLTHNPDVFPAVPSRVTLTLAGHTHGGQVRLPFVGAPIVPSRFGQRYAGGLIEEGGRYLFVSTGLGTSILPVRFRVPPEITLMTLGGPRG